MAAVKRAELLRLESENTKTYQSPAGDPEFDQAFIDLLDFYTSEDPTEWRLVLAGDFIDFVEVVVVPQAQGYDRGEEDVVALVVLGKDFRLAMQQGHGVLS